MGSNENEESEEFVDIPSLDWDAAAEEELRAIETAYASKRSSSHLAGGECTDRQSPRRRLPDWGDAARNRFAAHGGPRGGVPPPNGLWCLAPPPCRAPILRHPAMVFGGRIVYCKTASEVEEATMVLFDKIEASKQNADQVVLGFDIEWKPAFRRGEAQNKAAVMQICMDTTHCYVMHIIHSGIPPNLKSLLQDCSSIKVGVCIANDAMKVWRDYDACVEPVEDLSGFANHKLGGAPKRWSLDALTETLTCKELPKPKKIRMGNWEADILSREQLMYAATDAFVSWYLYQVLKSLPDAKSENETIKKVDDGAPALQVSNSD